MRVVERILALRERLGRGVAVGISGIDCAGKSTLAERLRRDRDQRGVSVLVVRGDEFTRPRRERVDFRESFDYAELFERLLPAVRVGYVGELAQFETAFERALARPRDLERMGRRDGVRERYATRYFPAQRRHLERDDPRALAQIVLEAK